MENRGSSSKGKGKILKRANPSTIQDKFLVGYQGWFTCPGDGEPVGPGHHGWLHWFNQPIPQGGRPNTDLWPDVSSYSPSELFPTPGLSTKSGDPVFLFSSRNAKTVQRHFHWMAEHGVDGAFLQRFAGQADLEAGNDGILRIRDEVGDRVREAAEREGRVFAIMYDISGVSADKIQRILERDWVHLIRHKAVLDSPNYLKEKGKPVVALWGFGFDNAGHTPALVRAITNFFRSSTPGGVYLFAGTPAHWRTAESDADRNSEFLDVWLNEFDAISPWTVGRYKNEQDAFQFAESKMKGDMELIKRRNEEGNHRKIDYIPVVLPGGSGFNLSEGKWGFNDIRRNGGRFLWHQIYNARRIGAKTMYGAMWDEYDEGTAFMPVVTSKRMLPASDKYPFMALDEDGYDLPSDWYMRICGFAAEVLRNERRIFETFPSKELQDYWGTRPRFEEIAATETGFVSGSSVSKDSSSASGSGAGAGDGQSYQEWLILQKEDKDGPPPPPYSLESDDAPTPALSTASSVTAAAPPASTQTTSANMGVGSAQQIFHASGQQSASGVYPSIQQTPEEYSQMGNQAQQVPDESQRTNTNSTHQPLTNIAGSQHQTVQTGVDPVEILANDLGRHGISSPQSLNTSLSMSPPPLHPAHPASDFQQHPLNAGSHSRPGSLSRPASSAQPQNGYSASNQSPATGQGATPTGDLWSQSQWPPAEWGITSSRPQQQAHPHVAQPAGSGANLTRPHTYSAVHSAGAPLRPHVSLSSRPQHQSAQSSHFDGYGNRPAFVSGPGSAPSLSMPSCGPASPYPASPNTTPSSYIPPQSNTPLHTAYGGPTYSSASFPAPHTWSGGPPHASPPLAASMSTYPSQGGYSPQAQTFGYQSSPFFNSSLPSPQMPMTHGYGHSHEQSPYFLQGPGGDDYSNNNASQHMHAPHQIPNYPGFGSSYGSSYPQAQTSSSPPMPNTGLWMPGGQAQAAPPVIPPRPSNQSSYNRPPPSALNFPVASGAGASALGFALSAVDKVAGRRTRDQLENQVGNLAHSGSKLLNKFTK